MVGIFCIYNPKRKAIYSWYWGGRYCQLDDYIIYYLPPFTRITKIHWPNWRYQTSSHLGWLTMLDTPWKINMNLQITNLERNMIFQTSRILFHVNLQGCSSHLSVLSCSQLVHPSLLVVQAAIICMIIVMIFVINHEIWICVFDNSTKLTWQTQ